MKDGQSSAPKYGANSYEAKSPRGFFSPASSLALDFDQLVLEAKSIESSAFAPLPSSYDFSPMGRKDILDAEEQLNSTSFNDAQRLAMQLAGATTSTQISFSVPSFQRKMESEKNEQIVSELREFGKSPQDKMSVKFQGPQTSTPVEQKSKTKADVIFGGLFSKLKKNFLSKNKSSPSKPSSPPLQRESMPVSPHINSILDSNPVIQKTPIQPSPQTPTQSSIHIPTQPSTQPPTPQTPTPKFPTSRAQRPSPLPIPSAPQPINLSIQNPISAPSPTPPKNSISNTSYEEPIPTQTNTKSPTKEIMPTKSVLPKQPAQSPIEHKRLDILKVGPKIFTPKQKSPKLDTTQNTLPIHTKITPPKKARPVSPVSTKINADSGGFDSPLISPKRRTSPPSNFQSSEYDLGEPENFAQEPASPAFREEEISTPKSTPPQKKKAPPIDNTNSQVAQLHTEVPHFGSANYGSKNIEPTAGIEASYSLSRQIQDLGSDAKTTATQKNKIEPVSAPSKVSPPKIKLQKKITKPLTSNKIPPNVPLKSAKKVPRTPNAIDDLESAANEFTSPTKQKSPVKKEKRISNTSAPQTISPTKKTKIDGASSSLAKRLGINTSTPQKPPIPSPKSVVKQIEEEEQDISDSVDIKPVVKSEEKLIDNSQEKSTDEHESESSQPGMANSKISNAANDLLTPKKEVDVQKQNAANMMADELLFAYAKENHKWLYEIYKMGGLSIEEFRARIKEKMSEQKGDSQKKITPDAADGDDDNKAFSNLSTAADKKFKK